MEMKVKITLEEEMLGSSPSNPDIHDRYIASLAPDALKRSEEVAAMGVESVVEDGMTIFPKQDGKPFIWDYQIKGFFKDSCGSLRKVTGSESEKIKAFKKEIDGLIFVKERRIPIVFTGKMAECQRPLRAETPQGPRVAIASSETVPAGSTIEFTIQMMRDYRKVVTEWLDYGALRGLGQWRNSGKGRFTWEEI